MSRNLCRDTCDCGYLFTIGDFRGKPVEFRKYGPYVPTMGVKLECPECHKFYFGWYETKHDYWGTPSDALRQESRYGNNDPIPNRSVGRFVISCNHFRTGAPEVYQTGYYRIDLSYYESYNDEGEGKDDHAPAHLFRGEDDLETRWEQS